MDRIDLIVRDAGSLNPLVRMEDLEVGFAVELISEWVLTGALGELVVEAVRSAPRLELVAH